MIDGKPARANELLLKADQVAPNDPQVKLNLGYVQRLLGHRDDAIRNLEAYLKLAPTAPDANQVAATVEKLRGMR